MSKISSELTTNPNATNILVNVVVDDVEHIARLEHVEIAMFRHLT